jgi:hypothetical protein
MKYFNECATIEDVKKNYRQLSMQHHPDKGDNIKTMQEVNTEYAFACAKILKGENLSAEDADKELKLSEEYRKVIEQISNLDSINIEVVGNWIWVTGNTMAVKEHLKKAGLKFAPKKVAWYYRSEEFATKSSNATLDEIRAKYGSEKVKTGTMRIK